MKKKSFSLSGPFLIKFIFLLAFLIISISGYSQNTGISATGLTPDAAAGLDVNYTSKGLLIPRIALTGTANSSPLTAHVAGMLVYNTATTADVIPGIYYDDGSKWIQTIPKSGSVGDMQYWNGTIWVAIPIGQPGQRLQLNASNIPVWVP